ncbi:MAG TPA: hypothetical protein QF753_21295 [Victivallales bacterium]|nr:hypothetical protein [Victivallales bacterium]
MSYSKKLGIGCLIAVILVILLIGILYLNWNSRTNSKVDRAGQYVLKVLKLKYDKDFVINKGHYITNTGGYEFTVHPKNDPAFTFNAWLNGMTKSGESDQYLYLQHRDIAIKWVSRYISDISNNFYVEQANPGEMGKDKLLSAMYNNNLSLQAMLNRFPNQLNIYIDVHINCNITPLNRKKVLEKVYKLIQFFKIKKFGYIKIALFFYNLPDKNFAKLGKDGINFDLDYLDKANCRIVISPDEIKNIQAPNDIQIKNIIRS